MIVFFDGIARLMKNPVKGGKDVEKNLVEGYLFGGCVVSGCTGLEFDRTGRNAAF